LLKRGELETYKEQHENASQVAKDVMDAIEEGYTFVLVYGSGPQLTAELMIQDFSKDLISWPLHANIAKVQGLVGHIIQLALVNEAKKRRLNAKFVTVLTHTLLDTDFAISRSSCFPVGVFLTRHEMERRSAFSDKEKKQVFAEVMDGIFRKVVASPEPKDIMEGPVIKN
jgi:carbamate kinase